MDYLQIAIEALQLAVLAWLGFSLRRVVGADACEEELRRLVAYERAKHARARGENDDVEEPCRR